MEELRDEKLCKWKTLSTAAWDGTEMIARVESVPGKAASVMQTFGVASEGTHNLWLEEAVYLVER
jgi:hypothetical protein